MTNPETRNLKDLEDKLKKEAVQARLAHENKKEGAESNATLKRKTKLLTTEHAVETAIPKKEVPLFEKEVLLDQYSRQLTEDLLSDDLEKKKGA